MEHKNRDFALFSPDLPTATQGIYNTSISADYPTNLTIGPSYFESYLTWPNVSFIHGFNLAKIDSASLTSLSASVPYACKALSSGNFAAWEMGNEPDLFKRWSARPANWDEKGYVEDWKKNVELVRKALEKGCGEEWTTKQRYKWIAPSFAGTGTNGLDVVKTWDAGLKNSGDALAKFSSHK
jgi:hypothetical protein